MRSKMDYAQGKEVSSLLLKYKIKKQNSYKKYLSANVEAIIWLIFDTMLGLTTLDREGFWHFKLPVIPLRKIRLGLIQFNVYSQALIFKQNSSTQGNGT